LHTRVGKNETSHLSKNQMKKTDSMNKLLIIDHINKVITQKRELNPPSFNGRFRDKIRDQYPDYELK
jgi:hypothetical protein